VREIGILTGRRVNRREIGGVGEFARLSDEELVELIEREGEFVPLPPEDDPHH
jgi:hypothetical protein